jgi:beta-N-acetylhexosaminidase
MPPSDLQSAVGRLLFVGIPGPALDDDTRRVLIELAAGGVTLFRRNIGDPVAVAALCDALHALPSEPLVAIDQEGGRVLRLGEPFTRFPPAAAIGQLGDAAIAYQVGRAIGTELASIGVDLDFAPVLDVHSNPDNPIIGDRSFGPDPALVTEMALATMRGLRDAGIIPCGKHFPGHGDTAQDSHVALPVVRRSRAEMERIELPPFRAAIAAGVPMLLTAHVVYTALDADHPATLSRRIVSDVLRGELGFDGVIATDDLEMRAILDHHGIGNAAVAALRAGVDVVLICEDLARARVARDAIVDAVESGTLDGDSVTAAAARVTRLRPAAAPQQPTVCEFPNHAHRALLDRIHTATTSVHRI